MGLLGGNLDYDHEEFHNGHSLSRRSGISGVMTLFVSWWRRVMVATGTVRGRGNGVLDRIQQESEE